MQVYALLKWIRLSATLVLILLLSTNLSLYANVQISNDPKPTYKVVVVDEWQPYYSLNAEQQPSGYAVELFKMVADKADINYEFVRTENWATALKMLKEQTVDIVPNIGIVGSRASFLYFSQSTDADHLRVFSLNSSLPRKMKQIAEHEIGVVSPNACVEFLTSNYPQLNRQNYPDINAGLDDFKSGSIPYLCYAEQLIHSQINGKHRPYHVEPPLNTIYRGMGITTNNFQLLPIIDQAISELRVAGELQALHVKWFTHESVIRITPMQGMLIIIAVLILISAGVFIILGNRWLVTKNMLNNEILNKTQALHKQTQQFKEQRNQAKNAEELLNTVLNNTPNLICYVDKNHHILGINNSFCQLLSKPKEELIGQPMEAVFSHDMHRILNTEVNIAMEWREVNLIEYWLEINQQPRFYRTDIIPFNFSGLEGVIITSQDLTEKALSEKKLRTETYHDELTHAKNLKAYNEKISELIAEFQRYKNTFSLLILDIDDFKLINDHYGHKLGDVVLRTLVQLIKDHIRENDFLYRVGGEEFVILFSDTTAKKALHSASMLRELIESATMEENIDVTISAGLTEINPNDDAVSIFKRADKALYEAKENGKNRVIDAEKLE